MPGCGYVCPKCNDSGVDENLNSCTWCQAEEKITTAPEQYISNDEWLKSVHEGFCCGDAGKED